MEHLSPLLVVVIIANVTACYVAYRFCTAFLNRIGPAKEPLTPKVGDRATIVVNIAGHFRRRELLLSEIKPNIAKVDHEDTEDTRRDSAICDFVRSLHVQEEVVGDQVLVWKILRETRLTKEKARKVTKALALPDMGTNLQILQPPIAIGRNLGKERDFFLH